MRTKTISLMVTACSKQPAYLLFNIKKLIFDY